MTTTPPQNLTIHRHALLVSRINEIGAWLTDHDYDVDGTAFRQATYEALALAFPMRVPALPLGVIALDAACAIAGVPLPAGVPHSNLPGARKWREIVSV